MHRRDVPPARVPARRGPRTSTSSARCCGSRRIGDVEPPPGDAPLVLVAPSTAQDPDHRLLRAALRGLAGEPVRVLAATGTAGRCPSRVRRPGQRPARRVGLLLADDAALRAGHLPRRPRHARPRARVAAPRWWRCPHAGDMAENAARADWAGVGVRLPWRLLTPATLRLAVRRALADPRWRRGRRSWRPGPRSHDGATSAAELVERAGRLGRGCSRVSRTNSMNSGRALWTTSTARRARAQLDHRDAVAELERPPHGAVVGPALELHDRAGRRWRPSPSAGRAGAAPAAWRSPGSPAPTRRSCFEPWTTVPSSVTSTGTQLLPVSRLTSRARASG